MTEAVGTFMIWRPGLTGQYCQTHGDELGELVSGKDLRRLKAIEAAAEALTDPFNCGKLDEGTVFVEMAQFRALNKALREDE